MLWSTGLLDGEESLCTQSEPRVLLLSITTRLLRTLSFLCEVLIRHYSSEAELLIHSCLLTTQISAFRKTVGPARHARPCCLHSRCHHHFSSMGLMSISFVKVVLGCVCRCQYASAMPSALIFASGG